VVRRPQDPGRHRAGEIGCGLPSDVYDEPARTHPRPCGLPGATSSTSRAHRDPPLRGGSEQGSLPYRGLCRRGRRAIGALPPRSPRDRGRAVIWGGPAFVRSTCSVTHPLRGFAEFGVALPKLPNQRAANGGVHMRGRWRVVCAPLVATAAKRVTSRRHSTTRLATRAAASRSPLDLQLPGSAPGPTSASPHCIA